MKRFVLLLLALFALVSTAHADVKLHRLDVGWHTSLAANWYSQGDSNEVNYGVNAAPGFADTSQTIDLTDYVLPPPTATATHAPNDSIAWLRCSFFPKSARTAIVADSVYWAIQVSDNGRDWIDTTPTGAFVATTLGAHDGRIVLEAGTSNSFFVVLKQQIGTITSGVFTPVLSSATEPSWLQLYGWHYMRFIIQSDVTGHYDAEVLGFKSNGK